MFNFEDKQRIFGTKNNHLKKQPLFVNEFFQI